VCWDESHHTPVKFLNLDFSHQSFISNLFSCFFLKWEYKRDFEENKGLYHFDAEAPEHLHHKGNATLQSQVRFLSSAHPIPTAQCCVLRRMEPKNINVSEKKYYLGSFFF
jgi:hypothetical protein